VCLATPSHLLTDTRAQLAYPNGIATMTAPLERGGQWPRLPAITQRSLRSHDGFVGAFDGRPSLATQVPRCQRAGAHADYASMAENHITIRLPVLCYGAAFRLLCPVPRRQRSFTVQRIVSVSAILGASRPWMPGTSQFVPKMGYEHLARHLLIVV